MTPTRIERQAHLGYPASVAEPGESGRRITPSDDPVSPGSRSGLTALLIAIVAWGIVDLALDDEQWLSVHVFMEVGFVLLLLVAIGNLWSGWMRDRRWLSAARQRARVNGAERDHWKSRAEGLLAGLRGEIDRQFDIWSLTPSEREVALLLLRGLGHKEIAGELDRSERTVRQHAVCVYRKSGLSGRSGLAAFFLDDLLQTASGEIPRGAVHTPEAIQLSAE